jgi:hypothetical protein
MGSLESGKIPGRFRKQKNNGNIANKTINCQEEKLSKTNRYERIG